MTRMGYRAPNPTANHFTFTRSSISAWVEGAISVPCPKGRAVIVGPKAKVERLLTLLGTAAERQDAAAEASACNGTERPV